MITRNAELIDGRVVAPKPGRSWLDIGVLIFLRLPILVVVAWMIYSLFTGSVVE